MKRRITISQRKSGRPLFAPIPLERNDFTWSDDEARDFQQRSNFGTAISRLLGDIRQSLTTAPARIEQLIRDEPGIGDAIIFVLLFFPGLWTALFLITGLYFLLQMEVIK